MYKKISLFLFAVGLSLGATAAGSLSACYANCEAEFAACKAEFGNVGYCGSTRTACYADCEMR